MLQEDERKRFLMLTREELLGKERYVFADGTVREKNGSRQEEREPNFYEIFFMCTVATISMVVMIAFLF
jgi:hypothetical protein